MKFYLSSHKFGDNPERLINLASIAKPRIGHINNARDWVGADPQRAAAYQTEEIEFLNALGFEAEALDLKSYFQKSNELLNRLNSLDGVWVSGGNTFVLRMAMHLSGLDTLLDSLQSRPDFLYAGYSAGICILAQSLKPIDIVDDPNNFPYSDIQAPIYDGLGILDYMIFPHYDSDHKESEIMQQEIQRAIDNKWLFKALRDGEVLILE